MNNQSYRPSDSSGFQYGKLGGISKDMDFTEDIKQNGNKKDEDLIIEENTIYEIDRECYDRLKKQKKRK